MTIDIHIDFQNLNEWEFCSLKIGKKVYQCWMYDPWGYLTFKSDLISILQQTRNEQNIQQKITKFCSEYPAEFAVVIKSGGYGLVIVDHVRSKPLFYTREDGKVYISDRPELIRSVREPTLIKTELQKFLLAGYVPGRQTLLSGIYQIPAGECLCVKNSKMNLVRNFNFWRTEPADFSPEKSLEHFNSIFLNVIEEFLNANAGRTIILLLSGGIDSRYILSSLYYLNAQNVVLLSYGRDFYRDVKWAREIAERTPFNWKFIPYNFMNWRKVNQSVENRDYINQNHFYTNFPYSQEIYTLLYLREKHLFNEGCIFINGDSGGLLSGSHLSTINHPLEEDFAKIAELLFQAKFNLWDNTQLFPSERSAIVDAIHNELSNAPQYNRYYANFYDWWEWREMTSKPLMSAKRQFSWFGHQLFHPFWDKRVVGFFESIPFSERRNQKFYHSSYQYLTNKINEDLMNVTLTKPGKVKFSKMKLQRGFEYFSNPRWGKYSINDLSNARNISKFLIHQNRFDGLPKIKGINNGMLLWDLAQKYSIH